MYPGSCECKSIQYKFTGEPLTCYACHCTDCQTASGSAFGLSMIINDKDIEIIKGKVAKVESLNDNEALAFYYPLVSDFFTIYNGNSFLIGRIKDNDLRKQIIKTYTLAKGMVDSFRLNNDLVSKWEFSEKLYAESQLDVHKNQAVAHYQSLIEYAKSLKESHKLLKQETSSLLRALRKNGVLNEKDN